MNTFLQPHINRLRSIPKTLWITYIVVYLLWGVAMNNVGIILEIARFTYWWQIITCYILYMVPISIILRPYSFFNQYAYGLVAMGLLEFMGYWLQTSYAYPNNLLDQNFNPQNFSLGMALFFALYFPAGNWLVTTIHTSIIKKK